MKSSSTLPTEPSDPNVKFLSSTKRQVIDFFVFKEDNKIQIRFESVCRGGKRSKGNLPHDLYGSYKRSVNNIEMTDDEGIHLMFITEDKYKNFPHSDIEIDIVQDALSHSYIRSSITYTLPTLPQHALTALGCLFLQLKWISGCRYCIHSKQNGKSQTFSFDNDETLLSMQDYANKNNLSYSSEITLLDSLVALKNDFQDHPYFDTLCAIETITARYHQYEPKDQYMKYNADFMYVDKRLQLLMPEVVQSMRDTTTDQKIKTRKLIDLCRKLISKNQQGDINFIIRGLNYFTNNQLFDKCIGKSAHDGGVYRSGYTERTFLKYAQFILDDNELLSIVNISNNPGYIEYYHPDTNPRRHKIFQPEMEYLFKTVWEAEFIPGCNFHDKITFTKESTHKLLPLGLHLTVEAIKKEMKAKNDFMKLFKHHKVNEIPIPKDVLTKIEEEVGSIYTIPKM